MSLLNFSFIIKYRLFCFYALLFLGACGDDNIEEIPLSYTNGTVKTVRWKDNKKAAITLIFDDSSTGQATMGVPALIERDITGTWFINPGKDTYIAQKECWEYTAPENGQELANHTMNHAGASTYNEVLYEVGEAARVIWRIRNQEENGSLIAFNRGGGTAWNETDLAQVLTQFHQIDRVSAVVGKHYNASVQTGDDAATMIDYVNTADSAWGRITFHAINLEPPVQGETYSGVWVNEFESFLDELVVLKSKIWIGGWIQVYKYIKEYEKARVTMNQFSESKFKAYLTADIDPKYYDEPITLMFNLPEDWSSCVVSQNGREQQCSVNNGVMLCNAIPNFGDIVILRL